MGKRYLEIKENSLESSVFNILHGIQEASGVKKEKLDPVGKEDGDIDNDGDKDASDKYLAKRRKTIKKAMTKKEGNAFGMALKAAKDNGEKTFVVSGKTYEVKEEVELGLQEKPADFIRLSFSSPADVKKAKKWMDQNLPGANQGFTGMDASGKDIEFEGVDDAEDLMAKLKKAGFKFKVDFREGLDEGKMSDLHQMIKDKKTPEQIAKMMKLDLKTIKALMSSYEKMVPESYEIGTEKYLKHTVNVTPGQKEWTETVTKKASSMREIMAKMWKFDEGKNVFEKDTKKDLTKGVKGSSITMTGKKVADIDTNPIIKEKKK
jgi:hypothetical protein